MEGIVQQLETLATKEQMRKEVGKTEEIPMLISRGGWFMSEGDPSFMLQPMEVGTAGFARCSDQLLGMHWKFKLLLSLNGVHPCSSPFNQYCLPL